MNQIKEAQKIIDEFTGIDKKVYKVFFSDPCECCIVFTDFTCEIITGLLALRVKNLKY